MISITWTSTATTHQHSPGGISFLELTDNGTTSTLQKRPKSGRSLTPWRKNLNKYIKDIFIAYFLFMNVYVNLNENTLPINLLVYLLLIVESGNLKSVYFKLSWLNRSNVWRSSRMSQKLERHVTGFRLVSDFKHESVKFETRHL